jgi:trimethylamine---corrinoid protein Co-methyltransferase
MAERRTRRGGGHGDKARAQAAHAIAQSAWSVPVNTDRPTEPLPPEGVAAIHEGAMRVLEEVGIDFLHPDARDALPAPAARWSTPPTPCGWAATSWPRCSPRPRRPSR